jgi:hypothetical protein
MYFRFQLISKLIISPQSAIFLWPRDRTSVNAVCASHVAIGRFELINPFYNSITTSEQQRRWYPLRRRLHPTHSHLDQEVGEQPQLNFLIHCRCFYVQLGGPPFPVLTGRLDGFPRGPDSPDPDVFLPGPNFTIPEATVAFTNKSLSQVDMVNLLGKLISTLSSLL